MMRDRTRCMPPPSALWLMNVSGTCRSGQWRSKELGERLTKTAHGRSEAVGWNEAGEGGRTLDIHVGNVTLYH